MGILALSMHCVASGLGFAFVRWLCVGDLFGGGKDRDLEVN
jgi:hypothetical protein